jgi:sugar/nucleoside kinase (ribokinase family)
LSVDDIDPNAFKREGAKILLVAGFFVLPGLLDHRLGGVMLNLQNLGIKTVLDVVHSPRMDYPEYLWPVLPRLDIFLCNATEAMRITGKKNYEEAAEELHWRGAQAVVVKLGAKGCYLVDDVDRIYIEGVPVENVVDTTGAGDAFAAGLISALIEGRDMPEACVAGNQAGAKIVTEMGAITAWGKPDFGL